MWRHENETELSGQFKAVFTKKELLTLNSWVDLSWPLLGKVKDVEWNDVENIEDEIRWLKLMKAFYRYKKSAWAAGYQHLVGYLTIINKLETIVVNELPMEHDKLWKCKVW